MNRTRASKITEPSSMAGTPPGATTPPATGDCDPSPPIEVGRTATSRSDTAAPNPAVMHGPTIDLTTTDAAMVKLFERLGALKGAASFFVINQGIDSLAAIHDLDVDAIESLYNLCRKPKPGHPVALSMLRHSSSSATFTFCSKPRPRVPL